MDRPLRRRLTQATAAAAVAAAAVACALLPAHALANVNVIVAVKTPTTLNGLEAAARGQRLRMAQLEAQMKVVRGQYDAAVAQLTAVDQQLSQTRLRLAQSQGALDTQNALLGARLAAMYKMGSFSILDVLAGSASFTQAQAQVTFFRRLALQDQRDDTELARLNAQVAGLAAALTGERAAAQSAQNVVDAQQLAMSDKIAQRRAILEQLARQIQRILDRQHPHNGLVSPVPLSGNYTPLTWAKALLEQLHMPLTTQNTAAITAWEMAEGGHWHNSAHYNPLNTTMPEPGATAMNSVGVKAYLSWAQGFTATIATLRNGYYGGILAALRAGNDAIAVADAVGASPWGTGNFSGLL
jgi:peptidoglycan hydrolase CwlO-like protein